MLNWLIPSFEVTIIAVMIYIILSFFWNTRTMDLIFGLLAFLGVYAFSIWFHLPVLQQLMLYFVNVAVLALIIIFQPELRIALSRLSVKGKKFREVSEFDNFLESLAHSIYYLSSKRIGALIILENQDNLDEYANKAVLLNAHFTSELLETIFMGSTPLHDGAVIIRGSTMVSAATILPLADESSQLTKSMGTRHRAGLGISQVTDSLIIVVSEENGKVSIAREGMITKGVKIDRFKGIVRSLFNPPEVKAIRSRLKPLEKLRQWQAS